MIPLDWGISVSVWTSNKWALWGQENQPQMPPTMARELGDWGGHGGGDLDISHGFGGPAEVRPSQPFCQCNVGPGVAQKKPRAWVDFLGQWGKIAGAPPSPNPIVWAPRWWGWSLAPPPNPWDLDFRLPGPGNHVLSFFLAQANPKCQFSWARQTRKTRSRPPDPRWYEFKSKIPQMFLAQENPKCQFSWPRKTHRAGFLGPGKTGKPV